ncbi:MAG: glucose-6-phosphate isomerase, partial [Aureliella sp.]
WLPRWGEEESNYRIPTSKLIRAILQMRLLRFDPSAAFIPGKGLEPAEVQALEPMLARLRDEVVDIDLQMLEGKLPTPTNKRPLGGGFYPLPERLLADYEKDRRGSELARILAAGKRIPTMLDRVVVLGTGSPHAGARALMDACCQPYWNELSRGERGSRPRMYFEGNNLDNDAVRGLLRLLASQPSERSHWGEPGKPDWGIVVVDPSGDSLETTIALRPFLAALEAECNGDAAAVRERVIAITRDGSQLFNFPKELGDPDIFSVPEGVGERFSVLSAAGLIPAAILGLNVVELLQGAAAMNQHFREASPGENFVLQYAAMNYLMAAKHGASMRLLRVWSRALESAGRWHEQLVAESLGKSERAAVPLTTLNARDFHARLQPPGHGRRDRLVHNLVVEAYRDDPLPIGPRSSDCDGLKEVADKTLPEVMQAAIAAANQSLRDAGQPTTTLALPRSDEASLGLFFQMLMLATVIEARLFGVNPYAPPYPPRPPR